MPTRPARAAATMTSSIATRAEVLSLHGVAGSVGVDRPQHHPPQYDEHRARHGDADDNRGRRARNRTDPAREAASRDRVPEPGHGCDGNQRPHAHQHSPPWWSSGTAQFRRSIAGHAQEGALDQPRPVRG